MRILLDGRKSIDENASLYFEKAKKAKKKLQGAEAALERSAKELENVTAEVPVAAKKPTAKKQKEWYEKFHWFVSSEGFLCIGGRDATTNEIVVKKHMAAEDVVFHTEMAGSPFFIVKTGGKAVSEATIHEASVATASYSRAWKLGVTMADVFHVKPEQLSKTPKSGEYLAKGAFIINGSTKVITVPLGLAVGITKDGAIMGGPLDAVKKNCEKLVKISEGNEKASDAAKKIRKAIGGEIDDIIRAMPAGGVKVAN
jgi:predicted ribosome quality control (RQC) complex YloA/Tae2 family protein